jgi:hypothetical protein
MNLNIYHPAIRKYLGSLEEICVDEDGGVSCNVEEFLKSKESVLEHLKGFPVEYVDGVFICPLFSEELCNSLITLCDKSKSIYVPNAEETYAAQIPEIVFEERYPDLFKKFLETVSTAIAPIFLLMTGTSPTDVTSVQLARYTPENTAHGCWHVDEDSLYTCVVSLAPERHEGGGTSFLPYGLLGKEVHIPPLPKGWAVFFHGKTTNHRGMSVTSGIRDLLVYWME